MALVKSVLQTELGMMFMNQPGTGITPGRNITKAFKNYLSMAQNAAGFPYSVVMAEPYGVNIGQIFQGMMPVGMTIGQAVGAQLSAMALTFMSSAQIGPPVAGPSHIPLLQMLFNAYAPSPMDFGRELGGIMADWSKTWVVSGIIPGTPPVPFTGPLS